MIDHPIDGPELYFTKLTLAGQSLIDGKPITVTDPNMTRFMMSLDQSVDLVTYAFSHAEQGDLFTLAD